MKKQFIILAVILSLPQLAFAYLHFENANIVDGHLSMWPGTSETIQVVYDGPAGQGYWADLWGENNAPMGDPLILPDAGQSARVGDNSGPLTQWYELIVGTDCMTGPHFQWQLDPPQPGQGAYLELWDVESGTEPMDTLGISTWYMLADVGGSYTVAHGQVCAVDIWDSYTPAHQNVDHYLYQLYLDDEIIGSHHSDDEWPSMWGFYSYHWLVNTMGFALGEHTLKLDIAAYGPGDILLDSSTDITTVTIVPEVSTLAMVTIGSLLIKRRKSSQVISRCTENI